MAKRPRLWCRGFSLLEMVVAMVVVGILSAAIMVRMSSQSNRAAMTYADQLRRDFAHAQALALSWGVSLRFSTASDGTGYSFSYLVNAGPPPSCPSLGTTPVDPATGQAFSVTLTDGVLIAPATGTNSTLDFDSLGRPVSCGIPLSGSPVRTYTLSSPGKSVNVTVQPITGFAATS